MAESAHLHARKYDCCLQAKYPLVKACDMPVDLKDEVLDICLSAAEKFPKDYEKCTQESLKFSHVGWKAFLSLSNPKNVSGVQTIKESLDRRAGGLWHVVAGINFAFDVTHKVTHPSFSFSCLIDFFVAI